jgi:hypothetical protein
MVFHPKGHLPLVPYSSFLAMLGVLNDVFIRRAFTKTNHPGTVRDVLDTSFFFP